ncbi:MAG: pilin [Candidatus Saccharibacteria bacterium]|nr:pilin [Candidatus Saccharibacteria bacterium]
MSKLFQKTLLLLIAVVMSAGLLAPIVASSTVFAAACVDDKGKAADSGILGLPYWWRGLCSGTPGDTSVVLESPVDTWKIVLNVTEAAMIIAGYAATGYVIWGGFKYMTSDGDEGRLTSAKKIITNSLIGLGIVLASVAMVNFVAGLI